LSVHKSRREFLSRDIFTQTLKFLNEMVLSYRKEEDLGKEEDYFDSFEKCYPVLSEAGEMLMEEAQKQGINVEGKSRLEIAREIFSIGKNSDCKEKGGEQQSTGPVKELFERKEEFK
jgi:hypothetical protein